MTTPTRIYFVTADDGEQRLVRAATPAAAIRHAARGRYRANVAAQETLVELLTTGVKVETAGDEPATPEEQQMAAIASEVRALDEPAAERAEPVVVSSDAWPYPTGVGEHRSAA